jgi:shikimate O-hydroxycinnamoyltransferase
VTTRIISLRLRSNTIMAAVVESSSFVAPSEATPRKGLWLSPADLALANRGHTPTVYFYQSEDGGAADYFDVGRLKASLAKALVPFYPLAGRRLDVDEDGRLQITSNSEGALALCCGSC